MGGLAFRLGVTVEGDGCDRGPLCRAVRIGGPGLGAQALWRTRLGDGCSLPHTELAKLEPANLADDAQRGAAFVPLYGRGQDQPHAEQVAVGVLVAHEGQRQERQMGVFERGAVGMVAAQQAAHGLGFAIAMAEDRLAPAGDDTRRGDEVEAAIAALLGLELEGDDMWAENRAGRLPLIGQFGRSRVALIERQRRPPLPRRLVAVALFEALLGGLSVFGLRCRLGFHFQICVVVDFHGVVLLLEILQRAGPGDAHANNAPVVVRQPVGLVDLAGAGEPHLHQGGGVADAGDLGAQALQCVTVLLARIEVRPEEIDRLTVEPRAGERSFLALPGQRHRLHQGLGGARLVVHGHIVLDDRPLDRVRGRHRGRGDLAAPLRALQPQQRRALGGIGAGLEMRRGQGHEYPTRMRRPFGALQVVGLGGRGEAVEVTDSESQHAVYPSAPS